MGKVADFARHDTQTVIDRGGRDEPFGNPTRRPSDSRLTYSAFGNALEGERLVLAGRSRIVARFPFGTDKVHMRSQLEPQLPLDTEPVPEARGDLLPVNERFPLIIWLTWMGGISIWRANSVWTQCLTHLYPALQNMFYFQRVTTLEECVWHYNRVLGGATRWSCGCLRVRGRASRRRRWPAEAARHGWLFARARCAHRRGGRWR